MPSTRRDASSGEGLTGNGELSAAISTAVVHVVSQYTGRGPTYARTTIDGELVVVILRESMTKGERALVSGGKEDEVLQLRRAFQDNMRQDLVAVIERLTERRVEAFMSANHAKPDAAAEIFLLDGDVADQKQALRGSRNEAVTQPDGAGAAPRRPS
jgi:uncharacterized protein YbcI